MQWMVPDNKLGIDQISVLDECLRPNKNRHWIQGFAGSGKTVLLVKAMVQVRAADPTDTMCFVTYTHALKDLVKTGFEKSIDDVPVLTFNQFENLSQTFDYIFVDEIQDLTDDQIVKLKNRANKKIIVAGDPEQSIFDHGAKEEVIVDTLKPEVHRLQVLYRLTQKIRNVALSVLPDSLLEAARISRMEEVEIGLGHASDWGAEVAWLWNTAKNPKTGDPNVFLMPRHTLIFKLFEEICKLEGTKIPDNMENDKDYVTLNKFFEENSIPIQYLGNGKGDLSVSDKKPLTYVMTYHSSKGLDFSQVFLPYLNEDISIWRDPDRAKRLFFVALTRSRRDLYLTYHTKNPISYIARFPANSLNYFECKLTERYKETESGIF